MGGVYLQLLALERIVSRGQPSAALAPAASAAPVLPAVPAPGASAAPALSHGSSTSSTGVPTRCDRCHSTDLSPRLRGVRVPSKSDPSSPGFLLPDFVQCHDCKRNMSIPNTGDRKPGGAKSNPPSEARPASGSASVVAVVAAGTSKGTEVVSTSVPPPPPNPPALPSAGTSSLKISMLTRCRRFSF